ncbi:outer membrane protein assembly factor BamB family protein [Alienimonas californiensis]|uniref:Outer membrane biogenesis protein BamB n=1 Tax=Alienimonas californiensis TaxID=2527989 RepID=A0A517P786_9PLAN|nr:PQQ-binding-like beta-propeller repeat protein [Alienimonas californiensis]QDT15237.1 outer membrane biogenesis protein BamB [Alienimonas californiensis]
MRNALASAGTFLWLVVPALAADGERWPQWRGPDGSGRTAATDVVTEWGPEQNVLWRASLPEAGNSTPVVWGDRVFLTQPLSENDQRALLCLDRTTGAELWRRAVTYDKPEATHKTNPYASASPAVDGERVVAWFGSAGLVCWDLEGKELWRRDLGEQRHMWGYGSSPILHGNNCILNFGPGEREFLIAVDKSTGETVWQVDALDDEAERAHSGPENDGNSKDFDKDGDRANRLRGAWSTPIVITVDGRDELIVTLPRRVSAFDPATGEQLWTCGGLGPLAYASPMASEDGIVVALGGYGGACLAVRAGGEGDVTETRRLWHQPRGVGYLGTGAVADGAVYVCDMGGVLRCLDVQTGKELWKSRVAGGGTWSSVTQTADGRMFLLTKSGTTAVFRANREEYEPIAANDLDESTNASVVAAGDALFLRTDDALWAVGAPAEGAADGE